jgi:hypothetical protein
MQSKGFVFSSSLVFSSPLSFCNYVIEFLLLCLIVAEAWKNLVFSSPSFACLIMSLYCQYTLCCSNRLTRWSCTNFLKFHSSSERSMYASIESSKKSITLLFVMVIAKLDNCDCQHLSTLLKFLNLAPKVFALSCVKTRVFKP